MTVAKTYPATHEDFLKLSQAIRLRFVKDVVNYCKEEGDLAKLDPDRQANLLKALADIEGQPLKLMKLKIEEDNSKQDLQIAAMLVKSAREDNINRTRATATPVTVEDVLPPPTAIPVKPLIEGETVVGDQLEKFEEFRVRTGQVDPRDLLLPQPDDTVS